MQKLRKGLKDNFWPVSAIIFCPCHLPLTLGFVTLITAGTVVGDFFGAYYNSIETVLAVTFSFYFVLAFMMWVVRGPKQREGTVCLIDEHGNKKLSGLSTRQIITWGIIGMFITPALVTISFFAEKSPTDNTGFVAQALQNFEFNSGFVWLISIAVVVMIPTMVIWLVWLWLAWSKIDHTQVGLDDWQYEYE